MELTKLIYKDKGVSVIMHKLATKDRSNTDMVELSIARSIGDFPTIVNAFIDEW